MSEVGCKKAAILQFILEQLKELRKHIRDVGADVKTEGSVIQDEIKTGESAVRNDVEDKLEKSISAVSVGQERVENRSLNQVLRLQAAKAAAGQPAKLQELTRARGGTPPTPPERRRDGRPLCWRYRKPGRFRRQCRQRPHEKRNQNSEARRRPPTSPLSTPRFTL
jgi:hypothetical protein